MPEDVRRRRPSCKRPKGMPLGKSLPTCEAKRSPRGREATFPEADPDRETDADQGRAGHHRRANGFSPLDSAFLLRRSQVFKEFLVHHHDARPPRGLDQRCPDAEPVVLPLPVGGKIVRFDRPGGLLREYSWAA